MSGLTFRNYRGPQDLPAMCRCANSSFAADGIDAIRTVEEMERDYGSFTSCVPQRDVWIAEVDGEVAGYIRCWHFAQADGLHLHAQLGFVAAPWRRQGLGAQLQEWVEQHQRRQAARQPGAVAHAHQAWVNDGETARAALLEKAGYRPVRWFLTMVRPTLDAIPDFPLPAGLEVRQVQPDQYRTIWNTHVGCFVDDWGFAPPDEAGYQQWLGWRCFQPHLWQVAWDVATDEVVGQVRTFIDESQNAQLARQRGYTEYISVVPRWRRQGVARALIARSLRAQKAAGMRESALGADSENVAGATRVYADCGFEVTKRHAVYRKPFQPEVRA